jgi:hypothetical protein
VWLSKSETQFKNTEKEKEMKPSKRVCKICRCPKCGKKFAQINGLFVSCKCGYVDDSTFEQVTHKCKEVRGA